MALRLNKNSKNKHISVYVSEHLCFVDFFIKQFQFKNRTDIKNTRSILYVFQLNKHNDCYQTKRKKQHCQEGTFLRKRDSK